MSTATLTATLWHDCACGASFGLDVTRPATAADLDWWVAELAEHDRCAPASPGSIAEELHNAVDEAVTQARAEHDAGTCHLSEWSCSWCEVATS